MYNRNKLCFFFFNRKAVCHFSYFDNIRSNPIGIIRNKPPYVLTFFRS